MTTSKLEVPGGRLHVIDEGPGPPIVLLHAGIADTRSWDDMVPLLNAAGYRTIRYDQRGAGQATTDDVEFSRISDLLAVLDAKGIDRAVLVGNSMGGAARLRHRDPGARSGRGHRRRRRRSRRVRRREHAQELALFKQMEELESADPVDPAAVADIDVRVWVDGPGQPPTRVPAAIRDLVAQMDLLDPSRPSGKPIRLAPPASERIAELRCPILAVAGELDVSEVAVTARHLEANAPNARALVWPDVAHMIGMEQPARLTDAIVEFLAPLERW